MPKTTLVANRDVTARDSGTTYCCSSASRVIELISRPAGISLMRETRFAKHSPALYARMPGAAISSISASRT